MILQANIARPGAVLVSEAELMRGSVRPQIRLRELVEIDVVDVLLVEHDVDDVAKPRNAPR